MIGGQGEPGKMVEKLAGKMAEKSLKQKGKNCRKIAGKIAEKVAKKLKLGEDEETREMHKETTEDRR